MKIKTEYLVLGIVIAAATAYLLFQKTDQENYQLPVLPKIDTAEVTRIDIERKTGSIILEKNGDEWRIQPGDFPADGARVKGMMFTFEDLALTALASESKAYGRYDLSEDRRITVRARAGDRVLRAFDVGKQAPTFQHTFVKLPGDDRVYHARGDFRRKFDRDIDGLRDKTVMSFIPERITAIDIVNGGRTLSLKKSESSTENGEGEQTENIVWTMADGTTAAPATVDTFMDRLNRMECQTFLTDKSPSDFKAPELEIVLVGDERRRLSVYSGDLGEKKQRAATSTRNPYVFSLAAWQVEHLTDIIKQWTGEEKKPEPTAGSASSS